MPPKLQAVEQVLPDDVKGQEHGRQRLEVSVCHPDAHGGVFLSEELAARHGVAVAVSEPLAEAELHRAHQDGEYGREEDDVLVAASVEEDVVDGAPQGHEERTSPQVERHVLVAAEPVVGSRDPQLQRQRREEGQRERGGDAPQNHQERLPEGEFRMHPDDGEGERRGHGNHQVAEHGVGGGRHAVGTEHGGDDHHGGGHGTEGAHHEALRQRLVMRYRPHRQIESRADHQLEEHQPEMEHRETQVAQIHRHKIEQQDGEEKPRHHKGNARAEAVEQQSQQDCDWKYITSIFLHDNGLRFFYWMIISGGKCTKLEEKAAKHVEVDVSLSQPATTPQTSAYSESPEAAEFWEYGNIRWSRVAISSWCFISQMQTLGGRSSPRQISMKRQIRTKFFQQCDVDQKNSIFALVLVLLDWGG